MTTTQHTQGKWTSSTMEMDAEDWAALNEGALNVVTRGQDVIAVVWCGDDRDGEEEANALLLAAGPRLLAAAETIALHAKNFGDGTEGYIEVQREHIEELCAAIAKARGQS